LRILGRGGVRWRRRLLHRAARRGLAGRFELPGHVADVPAHLRAADLFVSSSRWEGASNAVLEALACGTPIVATAAPTGIVEVLRPLGEEWLVPVGDAPALAEAIARRLGEPRGAETMMARARDYDLERTLGGYVGLLADQLSRALPPGPDHAETRTAHSPRN
jgi:glycosyltransferase involved in cell wall biosynthesis